MLDTLLVGSLDEHERPLSSEGASEQRSEDQDSDIARDFRKLRAAAKAMGLFEAR